MANIRSHEKPDPSNPLAAWRLARGLSQGDVAMLAGTDAANVCAVERWRAVTVPRRVRDLIESVDGAGAGEAMASAYLRARAERADAMLAATRRQAEPANAEATAQ